jgi:hypothetical protein
VDRLDSIEIFDICGLSAEYCRKCEALEIRGKTQREFPPPWSAGAPVEPSGTAERDDVGVAPESGANLHIRKHPTAVNGASDPQEMGAAENGSDPPDAEKTTLPDENQSKRATTRSEWLDKKLIEKTWTADTDIEANGGPTYNTIQRYRSGKQSTRDRYVRIRLSKAFRCDPLDVPE